MTQYIWKIFLLIATCLALTACAGTPFSWESARQIKSGMTIEEVTTIMGPPYVASITGGRQIYTWSYAAAYTGARSMTVVFVDGKVVDAPAIPTAY